MSESMYNTLRGKTKNMSWMSMTNQAQRSLFIYPVQRTIKPIITNPRDKKPRGIK
jgi:hypothetical protein